MKEHRLNVEEHSKVNMNKVLIHHSFMSDPRDFTFPRGLIFSTFDSQRRTCCIDDLELSNTSKESRLNVDSVDVNCWFITQHWLE